MAKANKTVVTESSVPEFVKTIKDLDRQKDVSAFIKLLGNYLKLKPKMWGTAIVGFGSYHYKYESGREGDAPLIGLASRSTAIVLYLMSAKEKPELLKKLGKHKLSGGCLHVKKLEDIDIPSLEKLIDYSIKATRSKHP